MSLNNVHPNPKISSHLREKKALWTCLLLSKSDPSPLSLRDHMMKLGEADTGSDRAVLPPVVAQAISIGKGV